MFIICRTHNNQSILYWRSRQYIMWSLHLVPTLSGSRLRDEYPRSTLLYLPNVLQLSIARVLTLTAKGDYDDAYWFLKMPIAHIIWSSLWAYLLRFGLGRWCDYEGEWEGSSSSLFFLDIVSINLIALSKLSKPFHKIWDSDKIYCLYGRLYLLSMSNALSLPHALLLSPTVCLA